MITIQRDEFRTHFSSRGVLNVNTMSTPLRESLRSHGIDDARLQRAANFDGEIRGEDFDQLYQELVAGDRIATREGRSNNLDRSSALFQMLERETRPIVVQSAQAPSAQPGLRAQLGNVRAPQQQAQPQPQQQAQPQTPVAQPQTPVAQGQPAQPAQPARAAQPAQPAQPPPPPGPPADMQRLTQLRTTADGTNGNPRYVSAARQAEIRATLRNAEQASQRGDYAAAAAAYRDLGFPVTLGGAQDPRTWETAYVLGAVGARDVPHGHGAWRGDALRLGARGNQTLNDLNSFAHNAVMMDAMTRANIGAVSNPPTQAQARAFMAHVARTGNSTAVMQAASMMTAGMINHYSSAGARNPSYGPRLYTFNAHGQHFEFTSQAAARRAQQQHGVRGGLRIVEAPGDWSRAMSLPQRAGRRIGDCENKEYLMHQLTAAAGFSSVGSVNVQGHGATGHTLGVVRDPSGRTFVTSNEQFYEVRGTGPNGAVTNANVEATAQQAIRDLYHPRNGDLRGFTFHYGREPAGSTLDPGVGAMRRAQGRVNERLVP